MRTSACLATFAANFCHVLTVLADGLAAFAARITGFISSKLVGCSLSMRCPTTFACDLALLIRIHGSKATPFFADFLHFLHFFHIHFFILIMKLWKFNLRKILLHKLPPCTDIKYRIITLIPAPVELPTALLLSNRRAYPHF